MAEGIKLPDIKNNADDFGTTSLFGGEIKISVGWWSAGSTFGQACFDTGEVKSTYGTGCFLILNTGTKIWGQIINYFHCGYKIGGDVTYALEGSIFVAGSLIQVSDKWNFFQCRKTENLQNQQIRTLKLS